MPSLFDTITGDSGIWIDYQWFISIRLHCKVLNGIALVMSKWHGLHATGGHVLPTLSQVLPPLDESSAQPLYQQLQRGLRAAIENRVISPDDALPPERDLAEMLSVSRITVRKAIDELVEEGLLIRKQGSGTFVSNRVEKNFAKLTSFSEDMRARGREPRSVWLNKAAGTVTPEESLTLRSSPGTPVYRFHRIRYADDAPMALEYATVLAGCLTSVEDVATSLYEALEKTGNRPVRALQRLRAVLLTAEQAKLLKAQERDAGLLVARVGYLKDGRAVEFSQSFYRGDIYDFVAELSASS
jgi:GntR family transcriptional regulator